MFVLEITEKFLQGGNSPRLPWVGLNRCNSDTDGESPDERRSNRW